MRDLANILPIVRYTKACLLLMKNTVTQFLFKGQLHVLVMESYEAHPLRLEVGVQ